MRVALVLAVCVAAAYAAISADEVTSLPGFEGALPAKLYSGKSVR